MRMRGTLVLATVAALLWAPSFASAAGNTLTAPTASPTTGFVDTVFTLGVTYDGQFPATAVTVTVAGLQLPMIQLDGTPEAARWSVSTVLPPGTWTPTYTATPLNGNTATAVGAPITVSAATPVPTSSEGPIPSGGGEAGDEASAPADPDAVDPETAPIAEDPTASGDAEPAASAVAEPTGGGGDAGATGTTSSPAAGDAAAGGAPIGSPDGGSAASGKVVPDMLPTADGRADHAATPGGRAEDAVLGLVLLIGLSGVAVVALIGTALLTVGRRRDHEGAAPAKARAPLDSEALLEQRAVRRARVRLADDPIVVAMGVDDQVAARRRRSAARQVDHGPGERPVRRRR